MGRRGGRSSVAALMRDSSVLFYFSTIDVGHLNSYILQASGVKAEVPEPKATSARLAAPVTPPLLLSMAQGDRPRSTRSRSPARARAPMPTGLPRSRPSQAPPPLALAPPVPSSSARHHSPSPPSPQPDLIAFPEWAHGRKGKGKAKGIGGCGGQQVDAWGGQYVQGGYCSPDGQIFEHPSL